MPGKALGRWLVDRTIKRRGPGSAALYALARRIVSAYENNDIHMETNGEAWLISELASRGPMVAVDIGANRGEWARYVLAAMNGGQVICYEPAPRTFGLLQAAVTDPRAVLVNAAASSKAGTLTFNINLDNDFVSSVVDLSRLHERSRYEAVPVPAVTGDDEMTRLGVERVGFLKIDAEGHDLEALDLGTAWRPAGSMFSSSSTTPLPGSPVMRWTTISAWRATAIFYAVCCPTGLRPAAITLTWTTFARPTGWA